MTTTERMNYRIRLRKWWADFIRSLDKKLPQMSTNCPGLDPEGKTVAMVLTREISERLERQQAYYGLRSVGRTAQIALVVGLSVMEGQHDQPEPPKNNGA